MFRFLKNFFRTPATPEPFFETSLGVSFCFETDLGWEATVQLDGSKATLVLGSNGERPNQQMLVTALFWIDEWKIEFPKLMGYIRSEIESWRFEPNPPVVENLNVDSLNILWPDQPNTCMIYFTDPHDDIRHYHLTLEGRTPISFSYDD
ncbi:MAG: hypothetical protein AAGA30_21945 [Planctomycetota bacterium]